MEHPSSPCRPRAAVLAQLAKTYTPNLVEAFASGAVPEAVVLAATGSALYRTCDAVAPKFRKFRPPKNVPVSFRKVVLTNLPDNTSDVVASLESAFADSFDAFVDATGFDEAYWDVYVHRHSMRTSDDFETFRDSIKIEAVVPCADGPIRLNHTYMP